MLNVMQLVEVTRTAKSRGVIQNKFTFVDLTGSERIKKTEVIDIAAHETKI